MKTNYLQFNKTTFTILFCCFISSYTLSQPMPEDARNGLQEDKVQADEMKADLDFLIENLKQHPQLYLYTPEAAYDHLWSAAYEMTKEEQSIKKFYSIIAPIVAKIQCSHTAVRIPRKYLEDQNGFTFYFPLDVYAVNNRLYTLGGDPEVEKIIPPGSEILSINYVPVENILQRLASFIPSEGSVQTTKYNELNREFKAYLNLLIDTDKYRIEYRDHEGIKKAKLKAVKTANAPADPGAEITVPLDFSLDEKFSIGLIRIPSFAVMDMNGYMTKLDSIFMLLRQDNTENLVVDLRDNPGGHPIFAAQLFSYLSSKDFTYFKRNPLVADFEPLYNPMQSNLNYFKGKLYILVNGGCLSTTGHLISLVDYHTDAVFIGEEPGSTYRCNDFSRQFSLPNSGIEANIPGTTFETAIPEEAKLTPFKVDHEISISIQDLIKGTDPYMEKIYSII